MRMSSKIIQATGLLDPRQGASDCAKTRESFQRFSDDGKLRSLNFNGRVAFHRGQTTALSAKKQQCCAFRPGAERRVLAPSKGDDEKRYKACPFFAWQGCHSVRAKPGGADHRLADHRNKNEGGRAGRLLRRGRGKLESTAGYGAARGAKAVSNPGLRRVET